MKTLYVTACAFLAGIFLLGCSANSLSLRKCGGSVRADTRVAGVTVLRASWQPAAGGRNRLTDPQDRATTQPTTQAAEQPYTAPRKPYRRRSYLELRRMQELRRTGGGGFDEFDQSIANMVAAPGATGLQPSLQLAPVGRAGTITFVALGEIGLQRGGLLSFRADQNLFNPTANPLAPVCGQLFNAGLFPTVDACHSRFAR